MHASVVCVCVVLVLYLLFVCTGACLEQAIPPRLFPQRLRIALYGVGFALFTYNFVDIKLRGKCGPDCPKVVVQGYVELSALDVLGKSFFLAAVLALHGAYRACRYSPGGLHLRFRASLRFIFSHWTIPSPKRPCLQVSGAGCFPPSRVTIQ